jgi:hypothetical protein
MKPTLLGVFVFVTSLAAGAPVIAPVNAPASAYQASGNFEAHDCWNFDDLPGLNGRAGFSMLGEFTPDSHRRTYYLIRGHSVHLLTHCFPLGDLSQRAGFSMLGEFTPDSHWGGLASSKGRFIEEMKSALCMCLDDGLWLSCISVIHFYASTHPQYTLDEETNPSQYGTRSN